MAEWEWRATKCNQQLAERQHATANPLMFCSGHYFQTQNTPSHRVNNKLGAQHGQNRIVTHHFQLPRFSLVLITKSPEITTLLLLLPPPSWGLSELAGRGLQMSGRFRGFGPLKLLEAEALREKLKAAKQKPRNNVNWKLFLSLPPSLPPYLPLSLSLSLHHGCHFQFTMTKGTRQKKSRDFVYEEKPEAT